jgi:hypothetical protein
LAVNISTAAAWLLLVLAVSMRLVLQAIVSSSETKLSTLEAKTQEFGAQSKKLQASMATFLGSTFPIMTSKQ